MAQCGLQAECVTTESRGRSLRPHDGKVASHDLVEPDPGRDLLRQAAVAFDGQRLAGEITPAGVAEINGDEISDPAAHHQIDGEARILHADIGTRTLENE